MSGHTHVGLQVVHGSSGLLLYSEAKPTCTGVYGELLLCNSPEAGKSHSFGGQYLELVPHEPIRLTDRFDDPNLPGEIQLTVTLKKVSVGTELNILQEGVPDVIPAEAYYLGWQESLSLLAQLVEAEISD